jgi:hypothetical protein
MLQIVLGSVVEEFTLSILTTALALLILPIGLYELASGHMPGGAQRWGFYRWLTTPLRVRVAALVSLAVCAFFLLSYPPETGAALIAGAIGLLIGCFIVWGSRRGKTV